MHASLKTTIRKMTASEKTTSEKALWWAVSSPFSRRHINTATACFVSSTWRTGYGFAVLFLLMTYSLLNNKNGSDILHGISKVYGADEHHPQIVLARILSNSLPPLHSEMQTTVNLEIILNTESLPASFSRYWVVSCVLNSTERTAIISLLKKHGETFQEIPLVKTADVQKMEEEAFNTNRARNIAIRGAFSTFNPKWVLIWDGCQFMTTESAISIEKLIEGLRNSSVFYTPMYRLIHNIKLTHNITFENLYEHLSAIREALLGMNRRFLYDSSSSRTGPFNETFAYGNGDKRKFLADLHTSGLSVGCPEGYHDWGLDKKRGLQTEMKLARECGFALRLLYHPDNKEYNQKDTIFHSMDKRREAMRRFRVALQKYAISNEDQ